MLTLSLGIQCERNLMAWITALMGVGNISVNDPIYVGKALVM